MNNVKVISIVVIAAILIMLICLGLYAVYLPINMAQVETRSAVGTNSASTVLAGTEFSRKTETAIILTQQAQDEAATQTKRAQDEVSTQTQIAVDGTRTAQALTAQPTITSTPTPSPTSTLTPTPTPTPKICNATVVGNQKQLAAVPGGGQLINAVPLARGTTVTIIGQMKDGGWYKAKYENKTGWLRPDYVKIDGGCAPEKYPVAYLLGGLEANTSVILDETMAYGPDSNSWIDSNNKELFSSLTDYKDSYIRLQNTAFPPALARSTNSKASDLRAFELTTSFLRYNHAPGSYVGIRFHASTNHYYAVHIDRTCSVDTYITDKLVDSRQVDPGANTCDDEQEDFLKLGLNERLELTVQLNDGDPFSITLTDPDGTYAKGSIELEAGPYTTVDFYYLVVTAPR